MAAKVLSGKKKRIGFKFLNLFKEFCLGRVLTSSGGWEFSEQWEECFKCLKKHWMHDCSKGRLFQRANTWPAPKGRWRWRWCNAFMIPWMLISRCTFLPSAWGILAMGYCGSWLHAQDGLWNMLFVALFRTSWKGQCWQAELLHVKLWVQEPNCPYSLYCSYDLLVL